MDAALVFDRPVTGRGFVGRKAEKQLFITYLREGKNVVLYAPPGCGCRSLVEQVLLDYRKEGAEFELARVNLMGVREAEEFSNRLELALATRGAGRLIVYIEEFQEVLLMDDGDAACRAMLEMFRLQEGFAGVSFVLTGSRFNAMKQLFERSSMFSRWVNRVELLPLDGPELIHAVNMAFLSTGKVIDRDGFLDNWELLGQNPYYFTCFASYCDSLSRGYITRQVMDTAVGLLVAVNRPRFKAAMADLTVYQVRFLRALFEGQERFSGHDVIERYGLNSSANVHRVKEALCKKEIITFDSEGDVPAFIDPLFRYWAAKEYFHTTQ